MCGRFALAVDLKTLIDAFGISLAPEELQPSYNIAPSQQVPGIWQTEKGQRCLEIFRWGLIPHWAKDPAIGHKMINARSETVAEKPSFRSAFRARRCILPASAFFEWQKQDGGKVPYCIRQRNGAPLAFAGLWENWQGGEEEVRSCTILTTEANELLKPIHHRMPVILAGQELERWLDPAIRDPEALTPLLRPFPAEGLELYRVDPLVNSPANNSPDCLLPAD